MEELKGKQLNGYSGSSNGDYVGHHGSQDVDKELRFFARETTE